jgi:hypothetical protein
MADDSRDRGNKTNRISDLARQIPIVSLAPINGRSASRSALRAGHLETRPTAYGDSEPAPDKRKA